MSGRISEVRWLRGTTNARRVDVGDQIPDGGYHVWWECDRNNPEYPYETQERWGTSPFVPDGQATANPIPITFPHCALGGPITPVPPANPARPAFFPTLTHHQFRVIACPVAYLGCGHAGGVIVVRGSTIGRRGLGRCGGPR